MACVSPVFLANIHLLLEALAMLRARIAQQGSTQSNMEETLLHRVCPVKQEILAM
jgi:hypothetical protein